MPEQYQSHTILACPVSMAEMALTTRAIAFLTLFTYPGDDVCEVPAEDFYAPRSSYRNSGQNTAAPAGASFDFNDENQPNPWHATESYERRRSERDQYAKVPLEEDIPLRRFADCHDAELEEYLASRAISCGFLTEIDLFLQGHPEIATCVEGRKMLRQLATLPPLEAYKCFLKGYTLPARFVAPSPLAPPPSGLSLAVFPMPSTEYLDGIIRSEYFRLPLDFPYQPLSTKRDPELDEFFDGFEYRHDIIARIDREVRLGMKDLAYGRAVPLALRKLVCYALWGNLVDAYKWFEYSYQGEFMPHRYLPEHVILGHLPKPVNRGAPRPSILTGYRKHGDVRARMARANDQGVDVLDVLIAEYRLALVRKAHRRLEIERLVSEAKQRLENERQRPTGVDIVDLVMDDAVAREHTGRRHGPHHVYSRSRKTYYPGSFGGVSHRARTKRARHTFNSATERRAPGFLQTQAAELRHAKATLLRLYNQENTALARRGTNVRESSLNMIRASRALSERRYVNCLIRYMRDAGRMTSFEATQLQKHFTRERMADLGVSHSNYLLGMYPRELY
ncbi:hypothetical protein FB567DRAFT_610333 [Paraphoma chrysanthemicola]|uniref:Uncharacterized protein n=1 Tax=Paraphoma chrysanthemicola TaxID=798071 RepID=A0A8K0RF54_9PLEO|nr:hypothetical protein FB567DRAFT_610333 [Paraphoma chrysanthemicola]